jgi:hypothetical protein
MSPSPWSRSNACHEGAHVPTSVRDREAVERCAAGLRNDRMAHRESSQALVRSRNASHCSCLERIHRHPARISSTSNHDERVEFAEFLEGSLITQEISVLRAWVRCWQRSYLLGASGTAD